MNFQTSSPFLKSSWDEVVFRRGVAYAAWRVAELGIPKIDSIPLLYGILRARREYTSDECVACLKPQESIEVEHCFATYGSRTEDSATFFPGKYYRIWDSLDISFDQVVTGFIKQTFVIRENSEEGKAFCDILLFLLISHAQTLQYDTRKFDCLLRHIDSEKLQQKLCMADEVVAYKRNDISQNVFIGRAQSTNRKDAPLFVPYPTCFEKSSWQALTRSSRKGKSLSIEEMITQLLPLYQPLHDNLGERLTETVRKSQYGHLKSANQISDTSTSSVVIYNITASPDVYNVLCCSVILATSVAATLIDVDWLMLGVMVVLSSQFRLEEVLIKECGALSEVLLRSEWENAFMQTFIREAVCSPIMPDDLTALVFRKSKWTLPHLSFLPCKR